MYNLLLITIFAGKTEYAYRLKGFNEDWMTTTYDKVTYTNLAPGTYMLKVKAVNSDGYGGDEEASLKIVIYPPFGVPFGHILFIAFWWLLYWYWDAIGFCVENGINLRYSK